MNDDVTLTNVNNDTRERNIYKKLYVIDASVGYRQVKKIRRYNPR